MQKNTFSQFVINQQWKLIKRIGSGSFGDIFLVLDLKTKEQAAAKLEVCKQTSESQLENEFKFLVLLKGNPGIPTIFWFGFDGVQNLYKCMISEYLGPSLEQLHAYCKCKFSIKTVAMLADQMIKRIEILHRYFITHRDIKPDNFVMGNGYNFNTLYIIDLGLSKYYKDPESKHHLLFKNLKNLIGTVRYCSINAHAGYEHSRRDDLESLGYVLIYFAKGKLPWQGIEEINKKIKFKKIYNKKISTNIETLCYGLPEEILQYLKYCRNLSFEEEPKYKYLRYLFWRIMEKHSFQYDFQFDWLKN